jgi:hypothetical protein
MKTSTRQQIVITDSKPIDDFIYYWKKAQHLDRPEKVKLFQEMVINENKAFYRGPCFQNHLNKLSDESLTKYLNDLSSYASTIPSVKGKVVLALGNTASQFFQQFPDMKSCQVHLVPSLGMFNGKTGTVNGKQDLFIGVDFLAKHGANNESLNILINHELFHVYHAQAAPQVFSEYIAGATNAPLYKALWTEGLATYVSKVLVPNASVGKVLMSESLASKMPAFVAIAAKHLLDHYESTVADDQQPYFGGSEVEHVAPAKLPARCGYYIGMLVAQDLAKEYSLPQLSTLQGDMLESAVKIILAKLAN